MHSYDRNNFLILTTAAQTINFALFELALQIKFYVTDSTQCTQCGVLPIQRFQISYTL
jgi:hypothetical protein